MEPIRPLANCSIVRGTDFRCGPATRQDRRELHDELRACAFPIAEGADGSAVKLDKMFRDGETEAKPRRFARDRRILLSESLENMREELTDDPRHPRIRKRKSKTNSAAHRPAGQF